MKFRAGGFCVKWVAQQRLAGPHATENLTVPGGAVEAVNPVNNA